MGMCCSCGIQTTKRSRNVPFNYLQRRVFLNVECNTQMADEALINGFDAFIKDYKKMSDRRKNSCERAIGGNKNEKFRKLYILVCGRKSGSLWRRSFKTVDAHTKEW
mgnify:CR=1 FL=1